jgi:hypothetical protein
MRLMLPSDHLGGRPARVLEHDGGGACLSIHKLDVPGDALGSKARVGLFCCGGRAGWVEQAGVRARGWADDLEHSDAAGPHGEPRLAR